MDISLTKLPWFAQIGVFMALALVGVGAFVWYYEMPVRTEMSSRETQLAALQADIAKGLTTAKQLAQFRAEVDDLEGRLNSLRAVLPEEKDAADLLRRMQTVATQSNLTIRAFKPAPTVTKQLHAEWPIALELEGTYHNLALFFDRVGKFTRIVNISGVDVQASTKPDASVSITARCVATTFVLLDKPAPSKPPTPAGAADARPVPQKAA
jgi:type IV pilus assembly protein PilO